MISKQEILQQAQKLQLMPNIIEKDYVIGWILAGIANNYKLYNNWIFKGGTCLKKCFFKQYRFSEDLDFTLTDFIQIDPKFLKENFISIVEWIYEHAGIELPLDRIIFEIYKNPLGNKSVTGKISYRGPMQRRGDLSSIKLDLTNDEIIATVPDRKKIDHPYSDRLQVECYIKCYCFVEIFAEKLRALIERLRPRDVYDAIHLYNAKQNLKGAELLEFLKIKCQYKNIQIPTLQELEQMVENQELTAEWNNMLSHQINNLKPLEHYKKQVLLVFSWLYAK